jgi:hypothetical protein
MQRVKRIFRIGGALLAVITLTVLLSGVPLLACPFLHPHNKQHACCQQPKSDKCPSSSTLENCPYYVTQSKLGPAETKGDVGASPIIASPTFIAPPFVFVVISNSAEYVISDSSGLHLKNRVLRI